MVEFCDVKSQERSPRLCCYRRLQPAEKEEMIV